jgi:carboxypeptidase family protein
MKGKPVLLITATLLSSLILPFLITNAHALTCPTPCNFYALTNVPASDGTVNAIAKGYPTPTNLNHTYVFVNGTINWVEVTNINFTGLSGARYVFKQWTFNNFQWDTNPNTTTPEMLADYSFTATYEKLLPLTLTFVDGAGTAVSPPSSITLTSSLGSVTLTSTQYTNHWLDAAVWTVSSVTWQGVQEVLGTQTIDLTNGPLTTAATVQAYPAKMQLVDNSNHPITGATVTVTLVNGTRTYTFTSDNQGYIDLGLLPPGTYNAHVTYQNQDYGPYSIDPVSSPTYTVTLSSVGGGVSTPVVSAFVLLAVFGLALFLIVLAIRVRKPPPPPMIG